MEVAILLPEEGPKSDNPSMPGKDLVHPFPQHCLSGPSPVSPNIVKIPILMPEFPYITLGVDTPKTWENNVQTANPLQVDRPFHKVGVIPSTSYKFFIPVTAEPLLLVVGHDLN
jgi:hypothetical protein